MKNGFTIVELLAAVGIMVIIIIISVPAYNGISKTIKENNYNSKISMIEKSTLTYISKYHKDKVFNKTQNILLISIPYLINHNVFNADDPENNTITDSLNGGILNGYLKVTYDIENYEVLVKYEEISENNKLNLLNQITDQSLNKIIINVNGTTTSPTLNNTLINKLEDYFDNENNKNTFIEIKKG